MARGGYVETHPEVKVRKAQRGVDSLSKRPATATGSGIPVYHHKVFGDDQLVLTGDGRRIWNIPADMNLAVLTALAIAVTTVSSSGIVQVQLARIRGGSTVDMLSTRIQIDASEFTSYTAATAYVINTSNDDVATADRISVDVDAAGTNAKGLEVIATFTPA